MIRRFLYLVLLTSILLNRRKSEDLLLSNIVDISLSLMRNESNNLLLLLSRVDKLLDILLYFATSIKIKSKNHKSMIIDSYMSIYTRCGNNLSPEPVFEMSEFQVSLFINSFIKVNYGKTKLYREIKKIMQQGKV